MSTVFASCNPILCGHHRALSPPTDPAVLLYTFQGLHRHVLQSKRTSAPLTALKASRGTRQAHTKRFSFRSLRTGSMLCDYIYQLCLPFISKRSKEDRDYHEG